MEFLDEKEEEKFDWNTPVFSEEVMDYIGDWLCEVSIKKLIFLIISCLFIGTLMMHIFLTGLIEVSTDTFNYIDKRVTVYYSGKQIPASVDSVTEETQDMKEKEVAIRLEVPDNINPEEVTDYYIKNLMIKSNRQFDQFFNQTNQNLKEGVSIFFVNEKDWDGEKICSWDKSAGCNVQESEKNHIFVSLTGEATIDLRTLNHERAHAYFLKKPEIVAELFEVLFAKNLDLSHQKFNLYLDEQGSLRFKPAKRYRLYMDGHGSLRFLRMEIINDN